VDLLGAPTCRRMLPVVRSEDALRDRMDKIVMTATSMHDPWQGKGNDEASLVVAGVT
jgi:hypothetical protein